MVYQIIAYFTAALDAEKKFSRIGSRMVPCSRICTLVGVFSTSKDLSMHLMMCTSLAYSAGASKQ